jgi:hypothetical protein
MPERIDVSPPLGDDVLWVPRIACDVLGVTVDQLIDLVNAGQLAPRQVDGMKMFREGDLYGLANGRTEPMPEPVGIGAVTPIMYRRDSGHVAVVWSAGRGPVVVQPEAVEDWAARVNELVDRNEVLRDLRDALREDLRQQQLRQQLAEREATDLRAEVELLRTPPIAYVWINPATGERVAFSPTDVEILREAGLT